MGELILTLTDSTSITTNICMSDVSIYEKSATKYIKVSNRFFRGSSGFKFALNALTERDKSSINSITVKYKDLLITFEIDNYKYSIGFNNNLKMFIESLIFYLK